MAYLKKYTSPNDLLLDENLSNDEKLTLLKQWSDDKKALMRASEEGMLGDDRGFVLDEIKKAIVSLKQ